MEKRTLSVIKGHSTSTAMISTFITKSLTVQEQNAQYATPQADDLV